MPTSNRSAPSEPVTTLRSTCALIATSVATVVPLRNVAIRSPTVNTRPVPLRIDVGRDRRGDLDRVIERADVAVRAVLEVDRLIERLRRLQTGQQLIRGVVLDRRAENLRERSITGSGFATNTTASPESPRARSDESSSMMAPALEKLMVDGASETSTVTPNAVTVLVLLRPESALLTASARRTSRPPSRTPVRAPH